MIPDHRIDRPPRVDLTTDPRIFLAHVERAVPGQAHEFPSITRPECDLVTRIEVASIGTLPEMGQPVPPRIAHDPDAGTISQAANDTTATATIIRRTVYRTRGLKGQVVRFTHAPPLTSFVHATQETFVAAFRN